MHEMQTVVTDVNGVCHAAQLEGVKWGSFGANDYDCCFCSVAVYQSAAQLQSANMAQWISTLLGVDKLANPTSIRRGPNFSMHSIRPLPNYFGHLLKSVTAGKCTIFKKFNNISHHILRMLPHYFCKKIELVIDLGPS